MKHKLIEEDELLDIDISAPELIHVAPNYDVN
jgi:hypothetical protein